ncbi:hypothetical protein Tco_0465765 [Tanacetum coccineum]
MLGLALNGGVFKEGDLGMARKVFVRAGEKIDFVPKRDVVTWNAMIAGVSVTACPDDQDLDAGEKLHRSV